MEKTAQRRSALQKLHEWSNVSGHAAEKFFSPELKRVMESLRASDDQIRANVVGDTIGKAKPVQGAAPLKELLKKAKSNLARREYMSAVSDLSRFHKQMEAVYTSILDLDRSVEKVHDEFLFNGLGDEQKQYLSEMKSRFAPKTSASEYELVKAAGIADFLINIGTKRGRALAMWEKRYPKAAEQLKKDTRSLIDESDSLLSTTLASLKEMGTARAARAVDDYIGSANVIRKKYENYDKLFRAVYARSYQKFIDQLGEQKAPAVEAPGAKELGNQEISKKMEIPTSFGPSIKTNVEEPSAAPATETVAPPTAPAAPAPAPALTPSQQTLQLLDQRALERDQSTAPAPQGKAPQPLKVPVNTAPIAEPPADPFAPLPNAKPLPPGVPIPKMNHKKFYDSLQKMSNESPLILASYIKKYASSIKSNDPETAIKLLNIVKSIRG